MKPLGRPVVGVQLAGAPESVLRIRASWARSFFGPLVAHTTPGRSGSATIEVVLPPWPFHRPVKEALFPGCQLFPPSRLRQMPRS